MCQVRDFYRARHTWTLTALMANLLCSNKKKSWSCKPRSKPPSIYIPPHIYVHILRFITPCFWSSLLFPYLTVSGHIFCAGRVEFYTAMGKLADRFVRVFLTLYCCFSDNIFALHSSYMSPSPLTCVPWAVVCHCATQPVSSMCGESAWTCPCEGWRRSRLLKDFVVKS